MSPPQIASTPGPPTWDLNLPTWQNWPELVITAALLALIVVPLIFTVRAMATAPTQTRAATAKRWCCCPCHTRPRSAQAPGASPAVRPAARGGRRVRPAGADRTAQRAPTHLRRDHPRSDHLTSAERAWRGAGQGRGRACGATVSAHWWSCRSGWTTSHHQHAKAPTISMARERPRATGGGRPPSRPRTRRPRRIYAGAAPRPRW